MERLDGGFQEGGRVLQGTGEPGKTAVPVTPGDQACQIFKYKIIDRKGRRFVRVEIIVVRDKEQSLQVAFSQIIQIRIDASDPDMQSQSLGLSKASFDRERA